MGNIFNKFFTLLQRTRSFTDDEIIKKLKEWSSLSNKEQRELDDFLMLRFKKFITNHYIVKIPELKGFWIKDEEIRFEVYSKTIIAFKESIGKGRFRGDSGLDAFFKGIFWHKCNDIYKKRDTIISSEYLEDLAPHLHKEFVSVAPLFEENRVIIALEILKKENPCFANLIKLKSIEGRSYEEIVKLDTCCHSSSIETLRNKLVVGKKRLEVILKNLD